MPWFKVDDSFESHPKVKGIPRTKRARAIGLWTLAGAWSARMLTDGYVPSYMLDELACTAADARALVAVDLWTACEGGYRFKGWGEWQPTREKVEGERAAAKERMRAARERKKGPGSADVRANVSATFPNERERSGEVRSTPRSVTPTRPDPTRPDQDAEASSSAAPAAAEKPGPKRATQRGDFKPTQAHIDLAAERGVDLHAEWAKFCDWCDANGKTYKDWSAALRNWIRNARPSVRPGNAPTRMQEHLSLVQQLAAEEADQPTIAEIGHRR